MSTIVQNCTRCGATSTTFDVIGDHQVAPISLMSTFEAMCRCRNCLRSSIALLEITHHENNSGFKQDGSISKITGSALQYLTFIRFISRADGAIIPSPDHLPSDVEQCFREGAVCFSVGCYNAAGAMFRLCLDMATKQLLPAESTTAGPNHNQRKRLYDRLEWLFSNGSLPSGLQDLAECVRQDGNDAAHDGTLTQADAEDLIDFSRILLERVYTEPERLRLANERRTARRAG